MRLFASSIVTVRVLFVCLGNICRSPMAEALFKAMVQEAGLSAQIEVDSAGIGSWHIGERAHPGTRRVLASHGLQAPGRARQISARDLADPATYVIAMDQSNVEDVQRRFGPRERLYRLLDFAGQDGRRDVPDPYYSGEFDTVYRLVEAGCRGLLAALRREEGL